MSKLNAPVALIIMDGWGNIPFTLEPMTKPEQRSRAQMYDPTRDSDALKRHPEEFEHLRGNYPLRREISFAFRKKGLTLFALILADDGNSKRERYSKADIHGISHGERAS